MYDLLRIGDNFVGGSIDFAKNSGNFVVNLFVTYAEQFIFAFEVQIDAAGGCVGDLTDMLHPHTIHTVEPDCLDSRLNQNISLIGQ